MSFNLSNVPATLHACEMHGKRAKKTAANTNAAPMREKLVVLGLDVTDQRFAKMLDECWPGSDLLIKDMAGKSAQAMDLISRKKMGEVRVRVVAVDGETEVFAIPVARAKGNPTLRIGPNADFVRMTLRLVGPIASEKLGTIDGYCEADVFVDVGACQTDLSDLPPGVVDGEVQPPKPKATTRRGRGKTTVDIDSDHLGNVMPLLSAGGEGDDEAAA